MSLELAVRAATVLDQLGGFQGQCPTCKGVRRLLVVPRPSRGEAELACAWCGTAIVTATPKATDD